MKKIVKILLCVCLVCSFAAVCGCNDKNDKQPGRDKDWTQNF